MFDKGFGRMTRAQADGIERGGEVLRLDCAEPSHDFNRAHERRVCEELVCKAQARDVGTLHNWQDRITATKRVFRWSALGWAMCQSKRRTSMRTPIST